MRQPWKINELGEVEIINAEPPPIEPGDWVRVESELGIALPTDYKQLIGAGPTCVFDEELFIASPFDPNPNTNLFRLVAFGSWALAYVRHAHPHSYPIAIYPEPRGMLGWGTDGGGVGYYWDTKEPDADRWTVFASGRPTASPGEWHERSLIAYLNGLRDGSVEAAGLGDWPSGDAKIRRWSG